MNSHVVEKNPSLPSLRTLALRLCVTNANSILSLGDLPFILVHPILQACSATQLALLEDQSPLLRQDTQEIWHRLVSERFRLDFDKREDEDWRDAYERLKLDEIERLKSATARLRAKNGKIKQEKMAKQIVVIDPKRMPVLVDRKRTNPFGSTFLHNWPLMVVHCSPPKKRNLLMEKARRDTSLTKMNYAGAPRFKMTQPTELTRIGEPKVAQSGVAKLRREPVPANDNNIFGKPAEIAKVYPHKHLFNYQKSGNTVRSSFFDALRK
jgi:RNA polymerase II transcription factor SIII (Elongin) subunit A